MAEVFRNPQTQIIWNRRLVSPFQVVVTVLGKGQVGLNWQLKEQGADIADARFRCSGPAADLDYQFWKDLGAVAKALGQRWGGDWNKVSQRSIC